MKKLILKMSVSVDGFVAGPKGELDWIFATESEDAENWEVETLWNASLHLMGSRTYQDMAAWWPTSKEIFAPPMNEISKGIFSRRGVLRPNKALTTRAFKNAVAAIPRKPDGKPSAPIWDSWLHPQFFTGNLSREIKRLKAGSGKPLLAHGGATFARSLVKSGLVDEYHLLMHPVVLGKGLPIFTELPKARELKLVECLRFKSGAIATVYRA